MSSPRNEEKEIEARAKETLNSALSRVGGAIRIANQSLSEFMSQKASDADRKEKATTLAQVLTKETKIIGIDPDFDVQIAAAKRAIEAIETCKKEIYGDAPLKKETGPLAWAKEKIKKSKNAYVSIKDIFMTVDGKNLPKEMATINEANQQRKQFATPTTHNASASTSSLEPPPLLSTLFPSRATPASSEKVTKDEPKVTTTYSGPKIE